MISIACSYAYAQSCSQNLTQAEREYEAGRLANIPRLIEGCLNGSQGQGFTKEEKIRAYKLLTLVHIFTDNEPDADRSLEALLKADPEHELDERVDPAELTYLYNQFQTKPIFRLSLRLGSNTTFPNVFQDFTAANETLENKEYNSSARKFGFFAELAYEKYWKYGIEGVAGVQYRLSSYVVDNTFKTPLTINATYNSSVTNSQSYLRVPLMIRYTYNYSKRSGVKPYIFIGGSLDYLLTAQYTEATRQGGTQFSLSENLDLGDQVNDFNFSFTGGIGLKLPYQTHFLTIEARYDKSFVNYIRSENRYNNQTVLFDIGHVEDNLTLDFVTFSVGWIQSIYNPKRLKEN